MTSHPVENMVLELVGDVQLPDNPSLVIAAPEAFDDEETQFCNVC
jgi:hypothetical protein